MTQGLTGRAWETGLSAQQGCTRGAHCQPRYDRLGHDTGHDTAKGGHDTAGSARAGPGWWIVSRYIVLYSDRSEGLVVGGCVTIQSLYRDKRAVWLLRVSRYNRLYRDKRKAWPLGVSQYNAATRPGLCCGTVEEPATRRAATRQGTPAT